MSPPILVGIFGLVFLVVPSILPILIRSAIMVKMVKMVKW